MAASATDILSLDDAKQELKVVDTNEFDSKIQAQIAAAVSFVEREIGRPLIDVETTVNCWSPPGSLPLCLRVHDVDRVEEVEYWPTDAELRDEPSGSLDTASLGRIDIKPDQVVVYPPTDGWPEVLSSSWLRVKVVRAFDVERHPSVRQAVILVTRTLYAGEGTINKNAAMFTLLDPWRRREPAVELTA